MSPAFLNNCKIQTIGHWDKAWTSDALQRWIVHAGGEHSRKLTEEITHVIVTEKEWATQPPSVKAAVDMKQTERPDLWIVDFNWLADCLRKKTRCKEKSHEFPLRQEGNVGTSNNATKAIRSGAGLIKEAFCSSTDQYVDQKAVRRVDRMREHEQRAREAEDEERKQDILSQQRSRNIDSLAMQDNGEAVVYSDMLKQTHATFSSGHVTYDVVVLRDLEIGHRVERLAVKLRLWQSFKEPYTYIVTVESTSTSIKSATSKVMAMGCPLPTAYRTFTKAFHELTSVKWEERNSILAPATMWNQSQTKCSVYHPYQRVNSAEEEEENVQCKIKDEVRSEDTAGEERRCPLTATGRSNSSLSPDQHSDSTFENHWNTEGIHWGSEDLDGMDNLQSLSDTNF